MPVIPLFRPSVGEEEVQAVRDALESGWIGLGPKTAEFERRFAELVGARHCVALNSATAALHLSAMLLELGPDDEVIVPAITFISTAHAVTYTGARVVFADVTPATLTIDPADVERKITSATRAIIPVHYSGHPCAMDELHAIARSRSLSVIEDAAHAAGAEYRGRRIGALSELTCFSFHAVKNMTTGEGGAVTTDSAAHAARLRRLRWVGIDSDTWQRASDKKRYGWYYEVEEVGYKYHMHDVSAAIGLVQLDKLERLNERRRAIARRYDEAFADLPWLETPTVEPWARTAQHTYVVKLERRDELNAHLAELGIATGVHYMPLHHHPVYRAARADVPVAERVWRRLLLLPAFPDLADRDQEFIIENVRRFGG